MSGHRRFSDLKKGWSPERLAANEARKAKLLTEMVSLDQLREGLGLSQEELANMKVSTLRDLIAAMGGELHITATFPDRSVEIGNFTASPA